MNNLIAREPVISAALAFLTAAIALLVAFGVSLTDEQQAAIIGLVAAGGALAAIVRNRVTPTKES